MHNPILPVAEPIWFPYDENEKAKDIIHPCCRCGGDEEWTIKVHIRGGDPVELCEGCLKHLLSNIRSHRDNLRHIVEVCGMPGGETLGKLGEE